MSRSSSTHNFHAYVTVSNMYNPMQCGHAQSEHGASDERKRPRVQHTCLAEENLSKKPRNQEKKQSYDDAEMGQDASSIRVEVLAFGNNEYSLTDIPFNGKLKHAVADAEAVAEALKKIGAQTKTILNVQGVFNLEDKLEEWANLRLSPDIHKQVRVVFIFWAGHAFQNIADGCTHLIPTGDEWKIAKMKPERETFSVQKVIKIVKDRSPKSKLLICLDSFQTALEGPTWQIIQHRGQEEGSDAQGLNGVDIWFSTTQDRTEGCSHFTQSILSSLGGDLSNKTFDDIWHEIENEMAKRSPDALLSRYKAEGSEHETLICPADDEQQVIVHHAKCVLSDISCCASQVFTGHYFHIPYVQESSCKICL
jgi:hypothetical protein